MYNKIVEVIMRVKEDENLFTLRDFNATIGKGRDGKGVGPFGLRTRNKRDD